MLNCRLQMSKASFIDFYYYWITLCGRCIASQLFECSLSVKWTCSLWNFVMFANSKMNMKKTCCRLENGKLNVWCWNAKIILVSQFPPSVCAYEVCACLRFLPSNLEGLRDRKSYRNSCLFICSTILKAVQLFSFGYFKMWTLIWLKLQGYYWIKWLLRKMFLDLNLSFFSND